MYDNSAGKGSITRDGRMSYFRNLRNDIFTALTVALTVLFSMLWQTFGESVAGGDDVPLYLEKWSLDTLPETKSLVSLRGFLLEDSAGMALLSPQKPDAKDHPAYQYDFSAILADFTGADLFECTNDQVEVIGKLELVSDHGWVVFVKIRSIMGRASNGKFERRCFDEGHVRLRKSQGAVIGNFNLVGEWQYFAVSDNQISITVSVKDPWIYEVIETSKGGEVRANNALIYSSPTFEEIVFPLFVCAPDSPYVCLSRGAYNGTWAIAFPKDGASPGKEWRLRGYTYRLAAKNRIRILSSDEAVSKVLIYEPKRSCPTAFFLYNHSVGLVGYGGLTEIEDGSDCAEARLNSFFILNGKAKGFGAAK